MERDTNLNPSEKGAMARDGIPYLACDTILIRLARWRGMDSSGRRLVFCREFGRNCDWLALRERCLVLARAFRRWQDVRWFQRCRIEQILSCFLRRNENGLDSCWERLVLRRFVGRISGRLACFGGALVLPQSEWGVQNAHGIILGWRLPILCFRFRKNGGAAMGRYGDGSKTFAGIDGALCGKLENGMLYVPDSEANCSLLLAW